MPFTELNLHRINECNNALQIVVMDEPGVGGACNSYRISHPVASGPCKGEPSYTYLTFHSGPVAEGVKGVTNEALLAILIHRMQGFQAGKFACPKNAEILRHLEEAFWASNDRTNERRQRGVEGTHAV